MSKCTLTKKGRKVTLQIFKSLNDEKPASIELTRDQWKDLNRGNIVDKVSSSEHMVQVTVEHLEGGIK